MLKAFITVFFVCLQFLAYSQDNDNMYNPAIHHPTIEVKQLPPIHQGGFYLQKSANSLLASVVMQLLGATVIALGTKDPHNNQAFNAVGGGLLGAGIGFQIAAIIRLRKSGSAFRKEAYN